MTKKLSREEVDKLRKEVRDAFVAKYPNLYPYVDEYKNFQVTGLWVMRDGRDGEGIVNSADGFNEVELKRYDEEAEKARQPDSFYCGICHEAKPREEYGFYYFALKYCKSCQELNPQLDRRAHAETYS